MVQTAGHRSADEIAFQEEQIKLTDVLQYIEDRGLELERTMPATASDHKTADEIQRVLKQQSDSFVVALDQPYFGRIDYFKTDRNAGLSDVDSPDPEDDRQTSLTVYLGVSSIPAKGVSNWTSAIGQLWYTDSRENGYTAPRGYIETRVDRKRYIRIREGRLLNVSEIFRREMPSATNARQALLEDVLSGTGSEDGHLRVIVETIEPEQYENIANVSDKVLVVQGAAGSGKSEIGLHRITFLLSPFNDIPANQRPTPTTTLFVGPSQAFLEYVDDILPSLGVQEGVARVKFSDWLKGRLSQQRVPVRMRIWTGMLAPGSELKFDVEAETFKGSMAMADMIDRHVSVLARVTRKRCLALGSVTDSETGLSLSATDVRQTVNEFLPPRVSGVRHLNQLRERFIDKIVEGLWSLAPPSVRRRPEDAPRERGRIRSRTVVPWCDTAWERIDFQQEYPSLLSDPKGAVTDDVAAGLAESARQISTRGFFDDSDLGALAYLDHTLNDTLPRRYRHIVVDEAQDISPIEFKLLEISSSNNWFTILGDTAQRLTPYRGISSWKLDLARVFSREDIEVQVARKTYRSNKQITTFNNRILRTFDKNIKAPTPFERNGYRVEYSRYRTASDMYKGVCQDIELIRSMDGMKGATVAILSRDRANMRRFSEYREQHGYAPVPTITDEAHTSANTVISRIHDMKGLEYDAVLVIGVNNAFSDTLFDKKLLYLATTRAKHYLGIHWGGVQSPILRSITNRGITWRRGRPRR